MHTARLEVTDFELTLTLSCGQSFCWQKRGRWYTGVIDGNAIALRQHGSPDGILEVMAHPELDEERLIQYLGCEDNLFEIALEVGRDAYTRSVLHQWWGLRIMRQPLWETLASFICATNTSVATIEKMMLCLRRKAGEPMGVMGKEPFMVEHYAFPSPEKIASLSVKQLKRCGLGYRAPYLAVAAQTFEPKHVQNYEEAKRWLLGFKGVGNKVADCVSLFGLGMLEAFPIDRWIRHMLCTHYAVDCSSPKKALTPHQYEELSRWAREYFGRYAGYAQQYLFHKARTEKKRHPSKR